MLSLRHTGLPDGEAAAMHEEGWRHFTSPTRASDTGTVRRGWSVLDLELLGSGR